MILELRNWEIERKCNCGIGKLGNRFQVENFLLFFAVLLEAVKMAVNSRASRNKQSTSSLVAFPVSLVASSQKIDSSDSSSTIPILAINSLWLLALQDAR